MADPKEKSWFDRYVDKSIAEDRQKHDAAMAIIADPNSDYEDRDRAMVVLGGGEYSINMLEHHVKFAIWHTVVHAAEGLWSLATGIGEVENEPQKLWPIAVRLAKDAVELEQWNPYRAHSAEEMKERDKRANAFAEKVWNGLKKDWEEAGKKPGHQTQFVFDKAATILFLLFGGELLEGEELAASGEILGGSEATCETVVLNRSQLEREWAAKEVEEASQAKTVEMEAVKDPSAAKTVEMPAAKDPSTAKTVEMPAVERPSADVTKKIKPLKAQEGEAARGGSKEGGARPSPSGWKPPKKLSGGKYADKGIPMTGLGMEVDATNPVKIFTESELEARRVVARDGKLVFAETGEPVTTTPDTIYVMDKHGNVFVEESVFGRVHHSSLAGGEEPVAGGHIGTEDGRLTSLNEQTGHYGGNQELGRSGLVKEELGRQGVDTAATEATPWGK